MQFRNSFEVDAPIEQVFGRRQSNVLFLPERAVAADVVEDPREQPEEMLVG